METNIDMKDVIDFYKTIIGFAAGSILLVANFISNIEKTLPSPCNAWFIGLIFTATVFFAFSILLGLFAIRSAINNKSPKKYLWWVIVPFGLGFVILLIGILIFLIN